MEIITFRTFGMASANDISSLNNLEVNHVPDPQKNQYDENSNSIEA